jgi:hypothetical protein
VKGKSKGKRQKSKVFRLVKCALITIVGEWVWLCKQPAAGAFLIFAFCLLIFFLMEVNGV